MCVLQVFDHHYHFDHLLDTAYEVEEGYYQTTTGQSPEAISPQSSQGDLSDAGQSLLAANRHACAVVLCVSTCGFSHRSP